MVVEFIFDSFYRVIGFFVVIIVVDFRDLFFECLGLFFLELGVGGGLGVGNIRGVGGVIDFYVCRVRE